MSVDRAALELVVGDETALAPMRTVHILEGEPPSPPGIDIAEIILRQDLTMFAGAGASAKSSLAAVVAVSTALGGHAFGTKQVMRPGPVIFCCPEDGEAGVRMILDAIIAGMQLTEDQHALLRERLVMVPDSEHVNLTRERDVRRLALAARECGAVLLIIDPVRNLIGDSEENDPHVATNVCDSLRRLVCRDAECSVLLCHHNRKPGKDAPSDAEPTMHDVRGSTGWVNSCRLVFNVSKREHRITMTAVKANRLRAGLKHQLEMTVTANPENAAQWLTCEIRDTGARVQSSPGLIPGIGRHLNENERATLACLHDKHESDKRLSWSRWVKESGLRENTFRNVKDRLMDAKLVQAIPTGKKTRAGGTEFAYAISETGVTVLDSGWFHAG